MTTFDPAFFGELYLESTKPFLTSAITESEISFLRQHLMQGTTLDLGCGHGRHLNGLKATHEIIGVDRDQRSILQVVPSVRADFESLPFRSAIFANIYAWYNTLGTFTTEQLCSILDEVSRTLQPGGRFIVQGTNRLAIENQTPAIFDDTLSNGAHLIERANYDATRRCDDVERILDLPDGRRLQAKFFIRYYDLTEWQELLDSVGLKLLWAKGTVLGDDYEVNSPDLILGAQKQ